MRGFSGFVTACGLGVVLIAGCPRPSPAPRSRPQAASPGEPAHRGDSEAAPRARAPRGPDIGARLLFTVRVGPTHRLDGRFRRLLRGIMPGLPMVPSRLFSRVFLSGLCREIGITPLLLDSLDLGRPAALGVVFGPKAPRHKGLPDLKLLAMIPYKGRGDIVVDALLASYPGSTQAGWGGVRLRRGRKTVAWVRLRPGWIVVAPTAPLLDSAARALGPLARGVPEGEVRAVAHADRLLLELRPFFRKAWSKMRGLAEKMPLGRMGLLEGILWENLDLVEEMAGYFDSLQRLEARLQIGDAKLEARLRVIPVAGGKTAAWLAAQSAPDLRLAAILPPGASTSSLSRTGEALRGLPLRLMRTAVDLLLPRLERELPHVVGARGLLRRAKPVTYLAYRRTLRDLNLKDYRMSYALYRLIFEIRALGAHTRRWGARLLAAEAGAGAGAVYLGKGRGLGFAQVKAVRDIRGHRRAMNALMVGYQRLWNHLFVSVFRLIPKRLRQRMSLPRAPIRVVFNPVALRVRGVSVSSLAIRLRWPSIRSGGGSRDAAELATVRRYVEAILGKGALTFAWAYVGRRLLVAGGGGWRGRMRALIRRARSGARVGASASAARLLSLGKGISAGAVRLLAGAFSVEQWISWVLDLVPRLYGPRARGMQRVLSRVRAQMGPLVGGPATAVRLAVDRRAGRLDATLSVPLAAIRQMMRVGALFFATVAGRPQGKRSVSVPVPKRPYRPPTSP